MDENNASPAEANPFGWLNKNKEWLFQGGGVTIVMGVAWMFSSKWSDATATNVNDAEKLTLALMMAMAVLSIAICIFLAYRALQANRSRILLIKRLDTIDKKLKSIEAPRRFEDWNKAQPEIQRLIKNSFTDFPETEIQCLGVALHVSWKTVRECLEDHKKTYGKFPNTTIRLKVLSPDWRHWEKLGRAWRRRNEAFYESITDFLHMNRGGDSLQINVTDYDSTPNWHGVLINGRHLFRSSCLYRNNEFTVHKNPYVYFRQEENEYSDMQISEFLHWFNHESRSRSLEDLVKICQDGGVRPQNGTGGH